MTTDSSLSSPRQLWPSVIEPLVNGIEPRSMGLFLYDDDGLVGHLGNWAVSRASTSLAIFGPSPHDGWESAPQLEFRPVRVPESELQADLVVIDSEPNYWATRTILNRLRPRPLVIVVHGTRWPHGRRDSYPPNSAVPLAQRLPASRRALHPGASQSAGHGILGDWEHAIEELTPGNGVRTAIDDELVDNPGVWSIVDLPGLGGTTVLFSEHAASANPSVRELVEHFSSREFFSAHLRRVEAARLDAIVKAAGAGDTIRGLETELAQARDLVALHEAKTAQRQQELESLRSEERRLGEELRAADEELRDHDRTRAELASAVKTEAELREAVDQARAESRASGVALEEAQRACSEAVQMRDALRTMAAEMQQELNQARPRVEQLQSQLDEAAEEAARLSAAARVAHEMIDAAAHSRSWRLGHRVSMIGRRLTFRPPIGTAGAVEKARDQLAAALRPALPERVGEHDPTAVSETVTDRVPVALIHSPANGRNNGVGDNYVSR
jgi:hypothetical protein